MVYQAHELSRRMSERERERKDVSILHSTQTYIHKIKKGMENMWETCGKHESMCFFYTPPSFILRIELRFFTCPSLT